MEPYVKNEHIWEVNVLQKLLAKHVQKKLKYVQMEVRSEEHDPTVHSLHVQHQQDEQQEQYVQQIILLYVQASLSNVSKLPVLL